MTGELPLSIPTLRPGTQSILVFGGTFDPPHRGHSELPRLVRRATGSDALLYVPAARSPLKQASPGATGQQRLEMLQLIIADDPCSLVTSIELERGGTSSYTIDTLEILAAQYGPTVRMRLLIGADQAADFHRWRAPEAIIRLAEPWVMLRAPAESWEVLRERMAPSWSSTEIDRWARRVVPVPTLDVSATQVRGMLARGDPDAAFDDLLAPPVLAYIRRHRLYGVP